MNLSWARDVTVEEIRACLQAANVVSGRYLCLVYVLKAHPQGHMSFDARTAPVYKIGVAFDAIKRAKHLRKKYGVSIEVIHQIGIVEREGGDGYLSNEWGLRIEQMLHQVFSSKQCQLPSWEWFVLEDDDLNWLKSLSCIDTLLFQQMLFDADQGSSKSVIMTIAFKAHAAARRCALVPALFSKAEIFATETLAYNCGDSVLILIQLR